MDVHHGALLLGLIGAVICLGVIAAWLLTRAPKKVAELSETDTQRIGQRLETSDISRSDSRFRRRYGLPTRDSPSSEPSVKSSDDESKDVT